MINDEYLRKKYIYPVFGISIIGMKVIDECFPCYDEGLYKTDIIAWGGEIKVAYVNNLLLIDEDCPECFISEIKEIFNNAVIPCSTQYTTTFPSQWSQIKYHS